MESNKAWPFALLAHWNAHLWRNAGTEEDDAAGPSGSRIAPSAALRSMLENAPTREDPFRSSPVRPRSPLQSQSSPSTHRRSSPSTRRSPESSRYGGYRSPRRDRDLAGPSSNPFQASSSDGRASSFTQGLVNASASSSRTSAPSSSRYSRY
ncbi:hypothetical protein MKEN_00269400 [Mycena kentingensis (nom. inval.)]|nr:hypothetical protein MKEN_00269400 [Mycena kentingensis (nom. inval.)]